MELKTAAPAPSSVFASVLDALVYWTERQPDALAVETDDHGKLTYGELLAMSKALAAGFEALGLRQGDRVAIQLPSSPEFVATYMACQMTGCVLTTLHMPYREEELRPLLAFAQPKLVVTAKVGRYDAPETMRLLAGEIGSIRHILTVSEASGDQTSFHDLVAAHRGQEPAAVAEGDHESALCFTSGTSAAPKAVLRKKSMMARNAAIFAGLVSMTEKDRVMIAPPLSHVFGLSCAGNALHAGATIVPIPLFSPEVYARYLTDLAPTIVYSAPAHLAATLKSGVLDDKPPHSVRDVIVGGSICPPKVAEAFEAKLPNGRVGCLFGMTETTLATQTEPHAPAAIRHGTVGKLAEGLNVRIVNGRGERLPVGEEGEMQISGYSVLDAYHENPAATAAAFTEDGWFRSGDLAVLDADGNITITGRSKDIINRGGIKINPSDLESLIVAHEAVVMAAVVPMPDPVLGERLCAYVTLHEGRTLTLADLCAFLQEKKVAKMRWPERLEVIDEMPMTPTRKIIKPVLVGDIRRKIEDEG